MASQSKAGIALLFDRLLVLHLYAHNVWVEGSAFPDEFFAKAELTKGGFTPGDWRNTNVVLETPKGAARSPLHRWAVFNHREAPQTGGDQRRS